MKKFGIAQDRAGRGLSRIVILVKRRHALVFIFGWRRLDKIRGRDSRPHGIHYSVEFVVTHVALPDIRCAGRPEPELRDGLRCGSALAVLLMVSQFGF
jgi:hypothetical protein